MNSTIRGFLFWTSLFVLAVLVWQVTANFGQTDTQISFTEFMDRVAKQQIERVELTGHKLRGLPLANDPAGKGVRSNLPPLPGFLRHGDQVQRRTGRQ